MGEPVSERAHYVTTGGGDGQELLLVQDGRVEAPGLVSIIWGWRDRRRAAAVSRPADRRRPGRRPLHTLLSVLLLLL